MRKHISPRLSESGTLTHEKWIRADDFDQSGSHLGPIARPDLVLIDAVVGGKKQSSANVCQIAGIGP